MIGERRNMVVPVPGLGREAESFEIEREEAIPFRKGVQVSTPGVSRRAKPMHQNDRPPSLAAPDVMGLDVAHHHELARRRELLDPGELPRIRTGGRGNRGFLTTRHERTDQGTTQPDDQADQHGQP